MAICLTIVRKTVFQNFRKFDYCSQKKALMSKILFLTLSSNENSNSTKLGERLIARFSGAGVVVRNLGKTPPPIIDQECSS